MNKWISLTLILLTGSFVEAASKADFLANKKKNIEARGNTYDPIQWSATFDKMDLNNDGILTPEELAAHDAAKKGSRRGSNKAPQVAVTAPAAQSVSGSDALFEGNPATTVWFNQAAKGFDQSLVLGNGRVGAMVFGDADEERVVLNEESVWSGSRGENNVPGGYKYLPDMRRLLAEEKFGEANALKKKAAMACGAATGSRFARNG